MSRQPLYALDVTYFGTLYIIIYIYFFFRQHLGDVVLALWHRMSETYTRSKTLHDHDKSSLPWRVKVLHDTAGMQPVSFSSCHSLSPNERFAATSRVGPTYWDVQANAARSRRGKLWADLTGHPCKNTRGGQRHEIRSS